MKKIKPAKTRGITLIEILIAIGVFGVIVFAVARVFVVSLDAHKISANRIQANFLMEEYLEKARSLRRDSWENISTAGRYIMEKDGFNNIVLTPTEEGETVDGFTRYLELTNVYRDTDGKIVDSGGTLDPSSIKTAVYIFWTGVFPGDLENSTILTRYLDNLAWPQTTEADFNAGTHTGTAVVNGSGGEVVLGSGGAGDWCEPDLSIAGLNLPKSGAAQAVTAIEGRAFAGTGVNASGESFININITNTNPPVASIMGTIDGYKTNDIFGEANYGYIATDTNSKEVVIINISSTPYSETGYFNIPANTDGRSIYVYGSTGYVTESNKLWNFDLSSKSGSRSAIDSNGAALSGDGMSVVVNGSYAYVASSGTPQLQIIDLTDPANMTVVGFASVNSQGGRDLFINQTATRAFLVTGSSDSQNEFFIIDIETKTGSKSVIGSYDTSGMDPKGVEVVPGGRAIIVGTGGEEYQVVDISNEASLIRCGGMQVDSGVFDSASVLEADSDAYSYIVIGDSSEEFQIIEGGPGGQYSASGTFESQTLDTAYPTAFNRFFVNFLTPPETNILFQVSGKEPLLGSCAGVFFSDFDFVGPDGTSGTYFSEGGAIPFSDDGLGFENPGQCFRTRAYLSTVDFSQTPMLYDFTVNYSP